MAEGRSATRRPAGPTGERATATATAVTAVLPTTRPEEEPWTAEELAQVRAGLEALVERLRIEVAGAEEEIAGLLRDGGDGAGDDQVDTGSKTFEREHELSLAANARDMWNQCERALRRIADGTYGDCESCARPIGKARLQAFPRATLCVTCKQREERR